MLLMLLMLAQPLPSIACHESVHGQRWQTHRPVIAKDAHLLHGSAGKVKLDYLLMRAHGQCHTWYGRLWARECSLACSDGRAICALMPSQKMPVGERRSNLHEHTDESIL